MRHAPHTLPTPQRPIVQAAVALGLILPLAGCAARYPLDIPEAQWEAMTPTEQRQAREQQAALDRARAEQRAAEARAREEKAREARLALEVRRQEARPGERVQCVLEGELRRGSSWHAMTPAGIDAVSGMTVPVALTSRDGRRRQDAYATFDGQAVTLCRHERELARPGADCARLVGTQRDFARGLAGRVETERFVRGTLRCDLPLRTR
ncbi:hypothetical protein [Halomonas sp. PGE1]|uniref:hypothetical protein n=1 Tax=Halomonas sp. PGE1 TaxID=2730360 RepID=UPI0014750A3E|nr:hypothetical protein [Halomonas sp. PGE1]QJQ99854.1 hypothetical protein HIR79_15170 [Halomonas sp. PGE1]